MKFKVIPVLAAAAALAGLAGCQSMEEMRAERAKKGEQVERITGSNIPRKDSTSDVKVASGEGLRNIESTSSAAAGAANAKGK